MSALKRWIIELYGFFHFSLKNVALETYSQLVLGTLEWRSENTVAELRIGQVDVIPVAP